MNNVSTVVMINPTIMHPQTNSPAEPAYAELHCVSNFSFLRGASHPEELVARAAHLGYTALAITDECSLAGVVRAHLEAKMLLGVRRKDKHDRPGPA